MSLENLTDAQRDSLAELAQKLSTSPDTRRDFQRLIKKATPTAIIPELEVEDAVAKATEPLIKANEELAAKVGNQDMAIRRRDLQAELKAEYPHLSFDDIEKTMVDHAIGNHKSAARFLFNERKAAEPAAEVPGRGGPMMMPDTAKQFFKTPTQTARKLAHEAVTDILNARRRNAA